MIRITTETVEALPINVAHAYMAQGQLYPGGPQLAKRSALTGILGKLVLAGVRRVACYDTRVSPTGELAAYLCQQMGLHLDIYYPAFTEQQCWNRLPQHSRAEGYGAKCVPIRATDPTVLHYERAAKLALRDGAHMLPWGLVTDDTVTRYALQAGAVSPEAYRDGTVVVTVGSGMALCGLLRGLEQCYAQLVGVAVGTLDGLMTRVTHYCGGEALMRKLWVIASGHYYYEPATVTAPFQAHPHYDAKALEWLIGNYETLAKPVLFWALG